MTRLIITVILFTLTSAPRAEPYFELGVDFGGDTLISTNDNTFTYKLTAGGGLKFALGVKNEVGENGELLSLSLGYSYENLDASNGTAKISTPSVDAIYSIKRNDHRFGIGASYHIGPTYKENFSGFSPVKIDFDNALGLILQYVNGADSGFQYVARITLMDYEVNGVSIDADSFGIFVSHGF